MKTIIGIDVGTQSMRAGVLDITGNFRFVASHDYSPVFSPGNRAEQDPKSWETALFSTLSRVGLYLAQQPECEVTAIAITSQRASVIPVDENGTPLYNALMWQDKRATAECSDIQEKISMTDLYLECGLRLDPYFSLPKMLWLRKNRPEVWAKTHKLLGVQDYVAYLLTGNYVTDWSQACRTMLLDLRTFEWNQKLLRLFDLPEDMLCALCPPGGSAGGLSEDYARRSGVVPAGVPVLLCGGDQQCAALALGLFEKGSATANTGTGSFVLGYAPKPTFDRKQRILCSAAAIPGEWIVEAGIYASGATYNWVRGQLFDQKDENNPITFEEVNEQVNAAPPGCNGVIVLPHFSGSAAPYWNPLAKGMFFNLGLGTKRSELCRAVLEGIAGEIADNIGLIAENVGEIDHVCVAGGLTRFPTYCQIMADNLQLPVLRRRNAEATLMGCLMSACVSLGIYPDYKTAYEAIVSGETERFEPIAENKAVYEKNRALRRAVYDALNAAGVYELAE